MYASVRANAYRIFEPQLGGRVGALTDWFIMLLIATNVAAVMLQTVDAVGEPYARQFHWFEVFSVAVFSVEYLTRVWSAVEAPEYAGPISGRLRFASRPLLLVDLIAILPFYLTGLGFATDLRFLRALRLVRLLRLFKLARYSESMVAFAIVLRKKKPDLVITLFANVLLLIVASSMMYYVEHDVQPEAFSSIPETMWWGIATLTTVGYGDVTPVTPLGKLLGAITAVLGIGLFALPASILASGYIEAAGQATHQCPHCGEEFENEY